MLALVPGTRQRMWLRRPIEPGESLAEYLFRFNGLGSGNANWSSTSRFPTDLARGVRWGGSSDVPHDEPSWPIRVQRTSGSAGGSVARDVSIYNFDGASVSSDLFDCIDTYIEWGLHYPGGESSRLLGDYLCTSPGSAAVSARSLVGVRRAVGLAVRLGRPGPFALAYAGPNAARIIVRAAVSAIRRLRRTRAVGAEERRALLYGPLDRILGTPVVALLGLVNTAIVVRETGERAYGVWCPWSRRLRCFSPSLISA